MKCLLVSSGWLQKARQEKVVYLASLLRLGLAGRVR